MCDKYRILKGKVISNKMDKSVVVVVERFVKHSIYRKFVRRSTKFYVHDSDNICCVGDFIQFKACRPISKKKFWVLVSVLHKAFILD